MTRIMTGVIIYPVTVTDQHRAPVQIITFSQYSHSTSTIILVSNLTAKALHPTDRTPNNINGGHEGTDESHQQVQQQHSNSYTDYQNCTSRNNINSRNSNNNNGYPGSYTSR